MKPAIKRYIELGALLLLLVGGSAHAVAQEKNAPNLSIERVLTKSLRLYAQASGGTPVRTVAASELPLPFPIQECAAAFCRIELNGESFWVDQMQVQRSRGSTGSCVVTQNAAAPVGALAGAGGKTCVDPKR